MITKKITHIWDVLRVTLGLLFILVGFDKFFDGICCWQRYISPALFFYIPVPSMLFMKLFGLAQIIVGILMFTRWIRYAIVGQLILLIGIFVDLITMQNQLMVIVHDVALILFVLILYGLNQIVLDLRKTNCV